MKVLIFLLTGLLILTGMPESTRAGEKTETSVFPGMPKGYVLSAEERQEKQKVRSSGIVGVLRKEENGAEFSEDTVFFLTEDEGYAQAVARAYGAELNSCDNGVAVLTLPAGGPTPADAVAAGADAANRLPAVYPDELVSCLDINDPYLSAGTEEYQWYHDCIGSWEGWEDCAEETEITVAVVDTDVLTTHEELNGRVERIEVGDDGLLNDGKRYYDPNGHGTRVAGMIGAALDNGCGGAGIDPNVKLLGIPVFCHEGGAYTSDIIRGVNTALENDADIINLSLGSNIYNVGFQNALDNAYAQGVTVLAGMGNDSSNARFYPAAYEHVIAVGATDKNGRRAYFSGYGEWCDISAPGSDIYGPTTDRHEAEEEDELLTDEYGCSSGTSLACPLAAGVCAAYMSVVGRLDPDEMEAALKAGANPCPDEGTGAGIVSLENMLRKVRGEQELTPKACLNGQISEEKLSFEAETTLSFVVSNKSLVCGYYLSLDGSDPVKGAFLEPETTLCAEELVKNFGMKKEGELRAVSVNRYGKFSTELSLPYQVDDPEGRILFAEIEGPEELVPGEEAYSYKACLLPINGEDARAEWSLEGAPEGVTIGETTGALTLGGAKEGSFTIFAELSDGSGLKAEKQVKIVSPASEICVKAASPLDEERNLPVYQNGTLTSFRLYTAEPKNSHSAAFGAGTAVLDGQTDTGQSVVWQSSDPSVAAVTEDGRVRAVGAGAAVLRCLLPGITGVSAEVAVTVSVPISSVSVIKPESSNVLACGKSVTLDAVCGHSFGEPSGTELVWSFAVGEDTLDEDGVGYEKDVETDGNLTKKFLKKKLAKIENGRLTLSKKAKKYAGLWIEARATASDGTGFTDSYAYQIVPPAKSIKTYRFNENGSYEKLGKTVFYSDLYYINRAVFAVRPSNWTAVGIESSDPEVLSVVVKNQQRSGHWIVYLYPHRAGTAEIRMRTLDGTNKKKTLRITVTEADI